MADENKQLLDFIDSKKSTIDYNNIIFDILEGDFLKHLTESLSKELSANNLADAITRAAPINVLRKIVGKLSRLYNTGDPIRVTDNPSDQALIDEYVKNEDLNTHWGNANSNFNSYKNTVLELYHDPNKSRLRTRSVPSVQFLPYSNDLIDPLNPTTLIKFMGKDDAGNRMFWVYSDDEFYSLSDKGGRQAIGETEGLNPYGILPFTYINQSSYTLVPTIDTDTVQMALLIGKLLVDINFGSKYQSHPIVYGIDMDTEGLERSPNILWNLKSDDDKKPEINVLKTDADIESQLNSLMQQTALWLQTKDIRPGTVGSTSAEKASSGISLMIQEMDTAENVSKQQKYFEEAENDYWKRLARIHNYLADAGKLSTRSKFVNPADLTVTIEYAAAGTVEDPTVKEARILAQLTAGTLSKKEAMRRLNPKMEEKQIEELLSEAKADGAIDFGIQKETNTFSE